LGVSAAQNAKTRRAAGYIVEIWPISSFADLQTLMKAEVQARTLAHHIPLSHLVIGAPWIPTTNLASLTSQNPDLEIAVVSHSNIGFLQADPGAIELLRQDSELEQGCPNFHIAANSQRFQTWWQSTYGTAMTLLPNMYPLGPARSRPMWQRGTLRMGCFCTIRPYQDVLTVAAAALEVGQRLRVTDLEFWISGGRREGGGQTILAAIQQMYLNVPRAKVVERNWQSWPQFLATVGSMDLLLQPSYTEGFNLATADGIAQLAGCCRRRLRHCQQGSRVAPRSYGSARGRHRPRSTPCHCTDQMGKLPAAVSVTEPKSYSAQRHRDDTITAISLCLCSDA
jgi:hypothetical protein